MEKNNELLCYNCDKQIDGNFYSIEFRYKNHNTIAETNASNLAKYRCKNNKGYFMAFHVECFEKVAGTEYTIDYVNE